MNVYIYEGTDRYNAKKSLIQDNAQIELGVNYTVSNSSGILVIAYPNEGVDTEFDFKYWLHPVYYEPEVVQ